MFRVHPVMNQGNERRLNPIIGCRVLHSEMEIIVFKLPTGSFLYYNTLYLGKGMHGVTSAFNRH